MSCYENLTTFTLFGTEQAKITAITATRSTVTELLRSDQAALYKDYGVGHFDLAVGIEHDFDFYIDNDNYGGGSGEVTSWMQPWALANAIDCLEDLKTANENFLTVSIDGSNTNNKYELEIIQWRLNARHATDTSVLLDQDTQYFVKTTIVGSAWTLIIYPTLLDRTNDTNRVDTLSIVLQSATLTFQYLYSVMSRNRFTTWITMWQQQYDIHEIVVPTVQTDPATNCGADGLSVQLNGQITATGGINAITRGFRWGLVSGGPYPNDWNEAGNFGIGVFNTNIVINCDVNYFYQTYAINCRGTTYGLEQAFLCPCPLPPVELCADYANQADCEAHGCCWCDGVCQDCPCPTPPIPPSECAQWSHRTCDSRIRRRRPIRHGNHPRHH